jgi:HEAT repeat protein
MTLWLLVACGPRPDAVVTGMSSDNPALRLDMVTVARKVDDPAVTEALLPMLQDPSADVRIRAIEALVEHEALDAVPAIAERVQDRDPEVQAAAIEALGQLGDPAGVEALITIVTNERRLDGIWALGVIGDARALPLLSQLAGYEADPHVAYNATVALRAIGDGAVEEVEPEPEEEPSDEPVEAVEEVPAEDVDIKEKDEKPVERTVAWPPGG